MYVTVYNAGLYNVVIRVFDPVKAFTLIRPQPACIISVTVYNVTVYNDVTVYNAVLYNVAIEVFDPVLAFTLIRPPPVLYNICQ